MSEYCFETKKAPLKNTKSSDKKTKNQSKRLKKVLWKKLESLTPFPENPRIHDDKQINAICTSIKSFGFIQPILVDEDNVILAGHGRYEAAKRLELKLVPVIKVKNLSKKLKNAYVIADNKIAEGSHWDKDALAKQFKNMIDIDFNVEITGFSTAETDILIDGLIELEAEDPGNPRPVDMDPPPVSRLGDLWNLGDNHYLFCGSALNNESYKILMQGKIAQMVFTDPPYNVPVDGHIRVNKNSGHREFMMASGEMTPSEFIKFLEAFMKRCARVSEDGSIHYICMDWGHLNEILEASKPVYGPMKQLIVWNKDNGGMGTFYRSIRTKQTKRRFMLQGLVYDMEGTLYGPVYTTRHDRQYCYYVSQNIKQDRDHPNDIMSRLPGHDLEATIEQALRQEIRRLVVEGEGVVLEHVLQHHQNIPAQDLVRACVERVTIGLNQLTISIKASGFLRLAEKYLNVKVEGSDECFWVTVPFKVGREKRGAIVIKPDGAENIFDLPPHKLKKIVQGLIWRDKHFAGMTLKNIAAHEKYSEAYVGTAIFETFELVQVA